MGRVTGPIGSFIAAALALGGSPARGQDVGQKIDEYMSAGAALSRFNSVVLVAEGMRVLLAKGYGVANKEDEIPINPDTRFRLGSMTKQFTAAAVLLLQQAGKLRTADSICTYVDNCPDAWRDVTIHQLLSHTAGIPDVTAMPGFRRTRALATSVPDLIARFRDAPLTARPGTEFRYSNSGYILLGAVIERVSGQSYAEFLEQAIFGPLGMGATGYDDQHKVVPHRARGYTMRGDTLFNADFIDMSIPFAAGGLYSTVGDLFIWENALFSGRVLPLDVVATMTTPVKGSYGYGLIRDEEFGRTRVQHTGAIEGFTAYRARFPLDSITIIVLSNVEGVASIRIGHDLAAIAMGEPYTVPVIRKAIHLDPSVLDDFVGEYERSSGRNFVITARNGHLLVDFPGRPTTELFPESPTVFFPKVIDAIFTFVRDSTGRVTHLVLRQLGEDVRVPRVR
jgi:CubicO group peptidase (beta-lactamase class C family)